jgi:Arc/MetJ family transcription regulator
MKRHEKLVDLHASAHSISDIRHMRQEIKSWREESSIQVNRWEEKESSEQFAAILAWLKAEESDQVAILDTIFAEGSKFAGTTSWVLKNPRIRAWLSQQTESPVLWLQGTAGSGKSVLASQIVKFMKSAGKFLIHHFCSQRYASSTTYEQILRSILLQLVRKDDELIAHVYKDFVLGKKSPTIQALEKLLYNLFTITFRGPRQSEYVWIIIDGLNECDTRRQINVINLMNQITNKLSGAGNTVCKILVSSRNSSPITDRLRAPQILSLTEEKNSVKLAIRQYVSQRLQMMHDKLAQLELTRRDMEEIERMITNKADGNKVILRSFWSLHIQPTADVNV